MTRIFLTQTPASAAFAEQLRQELRAKGYTLPDYPPPDVASASSRIERAIIGSAAVVLLWESQAASSEWQELHLHLPQHFQKPLFPVVLDATPMPDSLVALTTLSGQLPPVATAAALINLPGFPSSRMSNPLLALYEEATDDKIRVRRAAIKKAATMLTQNQHRDVLLMLLTYLAEHDQTTILQKEAGKVLLTDTQTHIPRPPFTPIEATMMVGGQCERGHQSFYNKRSICQQYHQIVHAPTTNQHQLDELVVPCQARGCTSSVVVRVDCGAYL